MKALLSCGISALQFASAGLTAVVCLVGCTTERAASASDQLERLVNQGLMTKARLDQTSQSDVPEKWRTTITTRTNGDYTVKAFSRGHNRVLEVRWRSEWVGAKSNRFNATIFDGTKRISNIFGFPDGSTGVMQTSEAKPDYELSTTIKPEGTASVTVFGPGFMDTIQLRGRDTHLMDDLEHMKAMVINEEVIQPSMEVLMDEMGKSKRKK